MYRQVAAAVVAAAEEAMVVVAKADLMEPADQIHKAWHKAGEARVVRDAVPAVQVKVVNVVLAKVALAKVVKVVLVNVVLVKVALAKVVKVALVKVPLVCNSLIANLVRPLDPVSDSRWWLCWMPTSTARLLKTN